MRGEVLELNVNEGKLGVVHRSGKRPVRIRLGDALLDPEGNLVGFVKRVSHQALPQFYWRYEITFECLKPGQVGLGDELVVEPNLNVAQELDRDAGQERAAAG